jgi:hypothetical protein
MPCKFAGNTKPMQKLKWLILVIFITACTKSLPAVKVAEESMVQSCQYIATLTEPSDPGKLFYRLEPKETQDKILARAANLRATHIVWVYDYPMGSAAVAYRCDH